MSEHSCERGAQLRPRGRHSRRLCRPRPGEKALSMPRSGPWFRSSDIRKIRGNRLLGANWQLSILDKRSLPHLLRAPLLISAMVPRGERPTRDGRGLHRFYRISFTSPGRNLGGCPETVCCHTPPFLLERVTIRAAKWLPIERGNKRFSQTKRQRRSVLICTANRGMAQLPVAYYGRQVGFLAKAAG